MAETLVSVQSGRSRKFAWTLLVIQLILFIIYASHVNYDPSAREVKIDNSNSANLGIDYVLYQDVHVMMFIGFGFLMTFLRRYGFSSVGFNFLLAALVIQVSLITNNFFKALEADKLDDKFTIGVDNLMTSDFTAAAVLITFGALLGKVSPLQLVFVAVLETLFFGLNEYVGALELKASDIGGSMFVHAFGAYFGLAASFFLSPASGRTRADGEPHPSNGSSYHNDLFAMIGTLFLWMFWPSFNGGPSSGNEQVRVMVNTVLSLSACCMSSFVFSFLMRPGRKFEMVRGAGGAGRRRARARPGARRPPIRPNPPPRLTSRTRRWRAAWRWAPWRITSSSPGARC